MTDQQVHQVEERSMTADTGTPVESPLNALDRCDRCGAQAIVKTRNPLGGRYAQPDVNTVDLLWCAHHYRKFEAKLAEFAVLDMREHV